jgi:hypothetical protein
MRQVSDQAPACPHCGRPFVGHDDLFSPEAFAAFFRTIFGATFRPRNFLELSQLQPHRYTKPKRMLLTAALGSALSVEIAYRFRPTTLTSVQQKVLGAAISIVLPWVAVLAFQAAGRMVAGGMSWRDATRFGGFKAAVSITLLPAVIGMTMFGPRFKGADFAPQVPALLITLIYGTIAFRSLGLGRIRALGGAFILWIAQVLFILVVVAALMVSFYALGKWLPELRLPDPTAAAAASSAASSTPPPSPSPAPAASSSVAPLAAASVSSLPEAPPSASAPPPVAGASAAPGRPNRHRRPRRGPAP